MLNAHIRVQSGISHCHYICLSTHSYFLFFSFFPSTYTHIQESLVLTILRHTLIPSPSFYQQEFLQSLYSLYYTFTSFPSFFQVYSHRAAFGLSAPHDRQNSELDAGCGLAQPCLHLRTAYFPRLVHYTGKMSQSLCTFVWVSVCLYLFLWVLCSICCLFQCVYFWSCIYLLCENKRKILL